MPYTWFIRASVPAITSLASKKLIKTTEVASVLRPRLCEVPQESASESKSWPPTPLDHDSIDKMHDTSQYFYCYLGLRSVGRERDHLLTQDDVVCQNPDLASYFNIAPNLTVHYWKHHCRGSMQAYHTSLLSSGRWAARYYSDAAGPL
jgi:hypothetical protein